MKHRIRLIIITSWAGSLLFCADTPRYDLHQTNLKAVISYEQVEIDSEQEPMGLAGLHLLAGWKNLIYAGVGSFGAITGNQGGLFTLGFEGCVSVPVNKIISIGGGGYFGGGGGNVYTGDGSIIRFHLEIACKTNLGELAVQHTSVNFPSSSVSGSQWGISFLIPTNFTYASPELLNNRFAVNNIFYAGNSGHILGYRKFNINLLQQNYYQKEGTLSVDGILQDKIIRLIGFEVRQYHSQHVFSSLKTSGAYGGIRHGYMDILLGIGLWQDIFKKHLSFSGLVRLGAGGGARVETGGGFLLETNAGFRFTFPGQLYFALEGGYLVSPDGNLSAASTTFQIGLPFNLLNITSGKEAAEPHDELDFQGWDIRISNQVYRQPKRLNMALADDVKLIGVKINRLFNQFLYLTGQGYFAYSGERAGGLAVGLLGAGLQTKPMLTSYIHLYSELLAGAAGGGHLALGEGAIIQPMAGISLNINPYFSIQFAGGNITAIGQNLDNPVYEVNLVTSFTALIKRN